MKRLLLNLGLSLLTLVVVGACAEAIVRASGGKPERSDRWRFSWAEKGEIWRLEPGLTWRTTRGGHKVRVNSLGFRDREFLPADPSALRVLFLGDSVTFGHGVAEDDTFVRRLERLLSADGRRARVLNAGIPGWSSYQEWLFYRDHGAELEPDLVLIGFVLNDVKEVQRGLLEIGTSTALRLARGLQWLSQHSAAAKLLKGMVADPEDIELRGVRDLTHAPNRPEVQAAMQRTAQILVQIGGLARERGDGFGLVLFPFQYQLRGADLDAPQKFLSEVARGHGLAVLDTLPILRLYPREEVFLDFDHLSPRGHEVVAAAIADWIEAEGLRPE